MQHAKLTHTHTQTLTHSYINGAVMHIKTIMHKYEYINI